MVRTIIAAAVCILFLFPATGLSQTFEGTVHYTMTEQTGETEQIIYSTDGKRTRMEIRPDSADAELVLVMNREEAFILIPKMNAYVRGKPPAITGSEKTYSKYFEPKDRQKQILDRTCRVYELSYKGEQHSLCLTDDLGYFNFGFLFMRDLAITGPAKMPGWISWLDEKGMAPLEIETEDPDSDERISVTVQSIEEQTVPASAFQIPENYKDITGMIKKMQEGDGG